MLEKDITAKIIKFLNGLPFTHAHKVHGGPYGGGEPDIDATMYGRTLKIEVKLPGGKPTERQAAILSKWEKAGAHVGCATSVDEAVAIVVKLLRSCDHPETDRLAAQLQNGLHQ